MNSNKFSKEELEAVSRVLGLEDVSSTSGNETSMLEDELSAYYGGGYAIAMNSGTSTLHSALAAIGVGEKVDDLDIFNAKDYSKALLGID